jgi:hypothetical protein
MLAVGTSYAFTTTATALPGRFFLDLAPAHGPATLQVPAVLLNSLGQTVRTLPLASTTVDLHGLATGVYTLRLPASTGTISRRLVVE